MDPRGQISEERFAEAVDGLRREFQLGLTTAGVQIGAVEKTLAAKLGTLRAWGIAALVGGQALAGLVASIVGPHQTAKTAVAVVRSLF